MLNQKLSAAVQSVEDHGYVMDIGIPNVRSFLAKAPELDLSVGQLISVCVINCEIEGHIATVAVSVTESIKFKQNVEFLNVSTLVPGTKVHVNVTKVKSFFNINFYLSLFINYLLPFT